MELQQQQRLAAISDTGEAISYHRHIAGQLVNAAVTHQPLANESDARSQYDESIRKMETQFRRLSEFDKETAALISSSMRQVPALSKEAVSLYAAGHERDAIPLISEIQRLTNNVESALTQATQRERDRSSSIRQRGERRSLIGWQIAVCIFAVLAIGEVLIVLTVLRSILRPLRLTTTAIQQVNAGSITIDLPPVGNDEFGEMAQAVRHFRDRAEKLNRLAYYDQLTGLGNRALLGETLESLMIASENGSLALIYLDLDRFRALDERVGNWRADHFLCEVANRLHRFIPASATLFRHGGDKFVVLFEDLDTEQPLRSELANIAERLMGAVAEPYLIGSEILTCSMSAGICLAPDDGRTAEHLIRSAEAATRTAKRAGGNQVRFADGQQTAAIRSRAALAIAIERGLQDQQFELFYQPIVDHRRRRVRAAEALVRWRHPSRGLLMAGDFIDVVEEEGLIVRLGEVCLQIAHRQARDWHRNGLDVRLAVNVSARQLQGGSFINLLKSLREDSDPIEGLLDLELTESTLFDHSDNTRRMLEEIRQLGYRLGLDDFGTGYSSLSYLLRLPIDKIKIDRTFTASMEARSETMAIVNATLTIAKALKLEIVAEGVETFTQASLLEQIGCSLQQGFFYSRALPPLDFEAWVADYEKRHLL